MQMVDASDVKESIQANTLYGFSDYDYIDNHKCYNFFDCDWFKKLMLIHLPSCYRTVQYANHINSYSLNQPISPFFANFPFLSYLGYFSFHGNCNFYDKLVIRLRVV